MKTATEFIKNKFPNHNGVFVLKNIEEFMIEFAKMHVQKALQSAYDYHTIQKHKKEEKYVDLYLDSRYDNS